MRSNLLHFALTSSNPECLSVIFLIIRLVPFVVLKHILNHGDANHENERKHEYWHTIWVRNRFDKLQESKHQEVDVCHLGELFEQIFGQERDTVVLCGADPIAQKVPVFRIFSEFCIYLKFSPFFFAWVIYSGIAFCAVLSWTQLWGVREKIRIFLNFLKWLSQDSYLRCHLWQRLVCPLQFHWRDQALWC